MTLMPTPLLDLTHIIAAEAIRQDVFDAGYHTIGEMLGRPRLDGTSATVLEWKKERLEQRICKMSCNTFRVYFKRLCLVAGMEKPPRPYFLQIGAGANFEGKATLHFFIPLRSLLQYAD